MFDLNLSFKPAFSAENSFNDVSFIKAILHNNIYTNYNTVIAFATEIVKSSDSLIFNSYNPATRTIEFKIKKSNIKKNKFLPFIYYQNIALVLSRLISTEWSNFISSAVHQNSAGVQSNEYITQMEQYKRICNYDQNFFMLLFNITTTTSNGILLNL